MSERIMAFDPGLHCGWATFLDGEFVRSGIIEGREKDESILWKALVQLLNKKVNIYVVEDYKIRPANQYGWQQTWESPFALQVIGAIKTIATATGAEFYLQQPAILPVAAAKAGMKNWTKKKSTHSTDAFLHGMYFLQTRKTNG